jgi:hypothetical protein
MGRAVNDDGNDTRPVRAKTEPFHSQGRDLVL